MNETTVPTNYYSNNATGYRVVTTLSRKLADPLLRSVLSGTLSFDPLYKDTSKCLVGRFDYAGIGGNMVLKVPRARSTRRWERFLTLFRAGESLRQFDNMKLLKELGLKGPTPILAAEKRQLGVVVDGFYIYGYVEGRQGGREDLERVIDALVPLYRRGYCRTDAKVQNHVVSDDSVYLIDFRLRRPWLFKRIKGSMELCQLAGSLELARKFGARIGYPGYIVSLAWVTRTFFQVVRKLRQRSVDYLRSR